MGKCSGFPFASFLVCISYFVATDKLMNNDLLSCRLLEEVFHEDSR